MKTEFTWNVELGGTPHTILCVMDDNGYDLYDGDDHITRIYRKSIFHNLRGGVEKDVEIAGHTVRFIAWNQYRPDIAVDGIMIGEGIPYKEARATHNKAYRVAFTVCLVLCAVFFTGAMLMIFLDSSRPVAHAVDSGFYLITGIICAMMIRKFK